MGIEGNDPECPSRDINLVAGIKVQRRPDPHDALATMLRPNRLIPSRLRVVESETLVGGELTLQHPR